MYQRSQLTRSAAIVAWNGCTLFTRDDFKVQHAPGWKEVTTSMYGAVDKTKSDLVIKISLKLWGAWENLSKLFPSYIINPAYGCTVFGAAPGTYNAAIDVPLTIQCRNGDNIAYTNVALTKLANLYLGVDNDIFAADVEFTALLGQGFNPGDVGAYLNITSGNNYSDSAFSKANFKRVRFTGAWGAFAGWGAIQPQKGFQIGWELGLKPIMLDGHGTVDMTLQHFRGAAKFIPVGPTMLQIHAQSLIDGAAMGTLGGSNAANLVMSGAGGSPLVTLNNAFLSEHGFAFGDEPLRNDEVTLETVTGFNNGVPQPIAPPLS